MFFRYSKLAALSALCLTCLLFFCACSDEEEAAPGSREEVVELELADLEKWNAYVDLYNESYPLLEKVQVYFKDLGTVDEPHIRGNPEESSEPQWQTPPGELERLKTLAKRVSGLAVAAPASELDSKAAAYAQGLERFRRLLAEAQSYYQAGAYRDDDWARGRKIHRSLLAAALSFEQVEQDFARALKIEERRRQVREAAELRKQGLKILPAAIEFGLAAQDVRDELLRQGIVRSNITALNLEKMRPLYQDLSAALEHLAAAGNLPELPPAEGLNRQRAEELLATARDLTDSVRAIISRAEGPGGQLLGAAPENFYPLMARYTRQYNQIITSLQQ